MPGRRSSAESPHAQAARRLGAHLHALRLERALTREAVAHAAGISPATLARLEQERTVDPGFFTVVSVAEALGTTLDALLTAAMAAPAAGLVSVGYEGHTLDSFVEHLAAGHVRAVADIRLNAVSRRPGFSKNRLRVGLADAGIDYVHLRALGNPQHNREPFRTGRVVEGCHAYRQQISTPDAAQALADLSDLARAHPTAVLCVERDEAACHRQVVLDILTSGHGLHRVAA